jgi:hypothetical protein
MNAPARTPNVVLSADLNTFFREQVEAAMHKRGFDATDAAGLYLVELLADYAKPAPLTEQTLNRPLTLLLDEALQCAGLERFERLRSLGDGVLYVSGFFGDHLENKGIELGYVAMLGATAYDSAARMLRTAGSSAGGDGAPDVFSELANKFEMFVDLLGDIAGSLLATSSSSDRGLLKLYERWLRTGSESLAQTLTSKGMVPVRGCGGIQ